MASLYGCHAICLFVFCLVLGVLAIVGFALGTFGGFDIFVRIIVLVSAILGCIAAWLRHRVLLFFTMLGFLIAAILTVISFIICLVDGCAVSWWVVWLLMIGCYIVVFIMAFHVRGKSFHW